MVLFPDRTPGVQVRRQLAVNTNNFPAKFCLALVDYEKKVDSVGHVKMFNSLRETSIIFENLNNKRTAIIQHRENIFDEFI